jgi:hypothetical protein
MDSFERTTKETNISSVPSVPDNPIEAVRFNRVSSNIN